MLIVGHPGHELRVYGWLMSARPVVQVLTDGSGSGGHSRIDSTTTLLDGVAAVRGAIYGRMTDREIYRAILEGDHARFVRSPTNWRRSSSATTSRSSRVTPSKGSIRRTTSAAT